MWLAIFFGGIRQFIRNVFSWKGKTPFWRIILVTNTVCVTAIICMVVAVSHKDSIRRGHHYTSEYSMQYEDDDEYVVVEEVIEIEEPNNE